MAVGAWQTFIGFAKETTWGTPVTPTVFIPSKGPKVDLKVGGDYDDGYRGNRSKNFSYSQGEGHSEVEFPTVRVYPDDAIHFLMAMLGTDAISGAGPYTHEITLDSSGANPPSYTVAKFDGLVATAKQATGVHLTQVDLKYASPGIMTIASKGLGKIPTDATKPTPTYSSSSFYVPWQAALTLGGGANARLVDMSLSLKAAVTQNWGMGGTQDVTSQTVDVLDATGSMTFVPIDYTEYNYYKNNTQPAISVLFTSGTNTLTLQMSKAVIADAPIDSSTTQQRIAANFTALENATDGNGPIKVIAVNSRATAY